MINLTLNKLKRPALQNLVPKFGTKVEKNDINKGGLSTAEVDLNMTLPFELMREIEVSSSDTTTKIQYDAKIAIVGSDPVTLTLDQATYKGCTITIKNRNTEQATIIVSEDGQKNLGPNKSLVLEWDGTTWIDTTLIIDSIISEDSHNPISSAAVYQALKMQSGGNEQPSIPDNTDLYSLKEYIDDPYIQEDDSWYDFVIDSDEKLAQLVDSAADENGSGFSFKYNRIKIKKGTWTYTLNTDNFSFDTYTKNVKAITFGECLHAEPGAKLILKGVLYGIIFKPFLKSNDTVYDDPKASYLRNLVVEFQPFFIFYYGMMLNGIHNCNIIINEKFHRENIHKINNTEQNIPIPMVYYPIYIGQIPNFSELFKLPVNSYVSGTDADIFNTNVYLQNLICNQSNFYRITADGLNIYKKCPAPAFIISDKEVPSCISSTESIFYKSNVNIIVTDDYSTETWTEEINNIINSGGASAQSLSAFILAFYDNDSSQFHNCNADIRLKCSSPTLSNSERLFQYSIQPMTIGFMIGKQCYMNNCNVTIDMCDKNGVIIVKKLSESNPGQIITSGIYGVSTSVNGSIRNCSSVISGPVIQSLDLDKITQICAGFGVVKNLEGCTARVFGINNKYFPNFIDLYSNTVFGYINCQNVTNCIALLSSCTDESYGFAQCKGMFKCMANSGFYVYTSKSDKENKIVTPFMTTNCCANIESYTAETAAAPTLEGGYNVDIGVI